MQSSDNRSDGARWGKQQYGNENGERSSLPTGEVSTQGAPSLAYAGAGAGTAAIPLPPDAAPPRAVRQPPLLQTSALRKTFGELVANDGIDLTVEAGQIHAILGENGAGKSTLMKMLYGVYVPDGGSVSVDGRETALHPPANARAQGIGMVFQDFRLVPALTVLENIALSLPKTGLSRGRKRLKARILDVAARYGLEVDPDAYVWQLDLGQRQRVEIVKVLVGETTRIVIFDEPTSVLTPQEVEAFLAMLRKLREDRFGILLITHKIAEVAAVADRVTVLRAGRIVFAADREGGFRESELIARMMGKAYEPESYERAPTNASAAAVLEARGLALKDDRGRLVLSGVDLSVRPGEIVGVAGISGNGQRELAESLFGARPPAAGTLAVGGADLTGRAPLAFLEAGVAYVSEDPLKESVVPGFSILEHMALAGLPVAAKGWGIDWERMRTLLSDAPEPAALGLAAPERRADRLSGGNVQRLVLTRAFMRKPALLVASYPSRGLDIGTVRTIHRALMELRAAGTAIVLVSEDLQELFTLVDRLVVLGGGGMYGPYDPAATDPYRIGAIMTKGEGESA